MEPWLQDPCVPETLVIAGWTETTNKVALSAGHKWGPAVCTWIYEDLRKVHGKNGENPREHLDFFRFFPGFSAPDFAKISAAVLRIFLVRSRAPETKIWPMSFHFFVFLLVFWPPKTWKSNFFLLFLKEQALKPCPGPRSRDLQKLAPIESSPNLNLTDLVKKEGRDFHFFSDIRYMLGKTPRLRLRITRRKKGNSKILHFPSFFFNDSTYTSISFFPPGALDIIESRKRTDGWPPYYARSHPPTPCSS